MKGKKAFFGSIWNESNMQQSNFGKIYTVNKPTEKGEIVSMCRAVPCLADWQKHNKEGKEKRKGRKYSNLSNIEFTYLKVDTLKELF